MFYHINEDIIDVKDIDCLEKSNGKMENEFTDENDIKIIKEIINRPFRPTTGGIKKNKRKSNTNKKIKRRRNKSYKKRSS